MDESLQQVIGRIEPTLVAVLSILVGLILLSVMLPLIGIMANIS
jgi:type IV pilus assembly protein PilC